MPLNMSSAGILEKNKLNSDVAWITLLKFEYDGYGSVRIAQNNENITWDGETWLAYPAFNLGDIEETKDGEVPQLNLTIYDVYRKLIPIIEDLDGGVGATVTIYIVHGSSATITSEAEFEHTLEIVGTTIHGNHTINLKLGGENLYNYRIPQDRYLKDHCRYKKFKGNFCGYSGGESECSRTFVRCKELNNQARFGGFPGVGRTGVMK